MTVVSPRNLHPASRQGPSDVGLTAAVTLFAALLVALVTRGNIVVGLVVLFLVFVPLERIFALHPRRVFRPGIVTDLTHLLANTTLVTIGTIALVVVAALPLLWLRAFDVEGALPTELSLALAVVVASIANYWGHRLTHEVPFLWRFHAVHHSIELMDWAAAARLHPIDSAFTQAFTVLPLLLLGYDAGVFASVAVFVTLLAIFQHANVRLRFPGVRWVVNTPEWHHWHHALDPEAREQELRSARRRQAVRDRVPPEGPATGGVRRRGPGPGHGIPRPPRVPVHRRRAATGAPGVTARGLRVAARTRSARAR